MSEQTDHLEIELMRRIYRDWHTLLATHCAASSVPEAFLAALISNESAGNSNAQRFEPAVFEHLKSVLLGTRGAYAPVGIKRPLASTDLVSYCDPGMGEERGSFATSLQCLQDLATSWGLTQIMGWHLLAFQTGSGVKILSTPNGNIDFAMRLLAWNAEHYGLDLAKDFGDLFDCWNTGDPMRGQVSTFDPKYVPNGMRRMQLYEGIALAAIATANSGIAQT